MFFLLVVHWKYRRASQKHISDKHSNKDIVLYVYAHCASCTFEDGAYISMRRPVRVNHASFLIRGNNKFSYYLLHQKLFLLHICIIIYKNIIFFWKYRKSQKTWDWEDDLGTFNRHFRKNERSLNKSKYGKKLLWRFLNFLEPFNRGQVYL